jgi:hypothetical protein
VSGRIHDLPVVRFPVKSKSGPAKTTAARSVLKGALRTSGFDPVTPSSMMKHRKKTDPIELLIEAMLDFALVAGFLSAIGFLVSVTSRWVF